MVQVINNFVNPVTYLDIVQNLDFEPILSGRRVVHFGYRYDYFRKVLTECDPIPDNLKFPGQGDFDQLIINEYKKGQGISAHVDDPNLFGPVIACISIGSPGTIKFGNGSSVKVGPGSLYLLEGDYRYKYTHQYKNGCNGVRYSLTYRTVVKK